MGRRKTGHRVGFHLPEDVCRGASPEPSPPQSPKFSPRETSSRLSNVQDACFTSPRLRRRQTREKCLHLLIFCKQFTAI